MAWCGLLDIRRDDDDPLYGPRWPQPSHVEAVRKAEEYSRRWLTEDGQSLTIEPCLQCKRGQALAAQVYDRSSEVRA